MSINKSMNDIQTLQKIVKDYEQQIKALKQAINILQKRGMDTDKRSRRNSENIRMAKIDINSIKGKLRS